MVDTTLLTKTVDELGTDVRRVLVTGATGFVGSRLAALLAAAGHDVVATGRNPYLSPYGVRFERADIRDPRRISTLCRDRQIVIHSAAQASPWEKYEKLHDVNVGGTQNVIDGCLEHGVERLVHVSSTAIHFNFEDRFDIEEHASPPATFACGYAETKYAAEQQALAACSEGLNAFVVRARAVYGPGDNHLMPRILQAYDQGTLRRIGAGENTTNLTYIDNLLYGLVLAIDRGPAGGICTITDGQPVTLWALLENLLKETGRTRELKTISYPLAYRYAHALEFAHSVASRRGEPVLTRYTVGLLSKHQTFASSAAREQLNYKPLVDANDGIRATVLSRNAKDDSPSTVTVKLSLHSTGYTTHKMHWTEHGARRDKVRFHAAIAVITHPTYGVLLFDTGYAPRFHQVTSRGVARLYGLATPVTTDASYSATKIVQSLGIDPRSIRILLSHLHADHIGGLLDFPDVDILAHRLAWTEVAGRTGLSAVRRAFLPELLPEDVKKRLCLFEHFHGPGMGPFSQTHDLFGDGSVKLLELPGHAAGQVGVLLQTSDSERKLLVADAVWSRRTITEDLPLTRPFRLLADDAAKARRTHQELVQFHRQYPSVEIIPTHCPEVAREHAFDRSTAVE